MGLRTRFERLLDLGPADDPRRVAVTATRKRVESPVVSTPGAALCIERSGNDGEVLRLVLWCHRRGIAMTLIPGDTDSITLHGERLTASDARNRLRRREPR
jgi:hypothetical protein